MHRSVFALVLAVTIAGVCYGQTQPTTCPSGWLSYKNYCYFFQNNATNRITWQQAQGECKARQASLLRIETTDEWAFIKQTYDTQQNAAPSYWTALNDLPTDPGASQYKTVFMWDNDELTDDAVVKNHWDAEPDNTDFDDCVHINIQASCSMDNCGIRHGYVCEIAITDTVNVGCPNGWTTDGGTFCYFASNVSNWADVKNWTDAKATCESKTPFGDGRKARLLSITTQGAQMFIANFLSWTQITNQVYWTGLNDIAREHNLVWDDFPTASYDASIVQWRQEPNNLGGNEHCGSMVPGARFADSNCQSQRNYVCRMGLNVGNMWNFGCGNWLRAGTKCVYVFTAPTKKWSDARSICQADGGDLYKFDDEDDVMWIRSMAPRMFTLSGYFIGLNDQATENTFLWTDGSEPTGSLLDWDQEPNTDPVTGGQSNCAWISYASFFITGQCWGPNKAGAICETKTGPCGPGWLSKGQSCYFFDEHWRTQMEAQAFCKTNSPNGNGQLLALNDQPEKEFIKNHLATMVGNGFGGYWTSLIQDSPDSAWYWSNPNDDPSTVNTLVDWSSEPNNWNNMEDCVQVNIHGHLNDVDCAAPGGYICQRAIGAGSSQVLASWTMVCVLAVVVARFFT